MRTGTKIAIGATAGVLVIGGTAYAIKKHKKKKQVAAGVEDAQTEAQIILKNNAHLPADQQIRASVTPQQMKAYADKLETAMKGLGTDDEAVTNVAKAMNNDLDVLLLIDAFGVRDDDNLSQWLEDDGATDEFNAVLETKANVTKRF